jgi:dienelactone hydrolase
MLSAVALLTAAATSWTGTWNAGSGEDAIGVRLSPRIAVVALGAGHADAQTVPLRRSGGRIRFTIPGRPALAFDGRVRGGRLSGTTRQGAARGTFSLRPGPAGALFARGSYAGGGRRWALVDDPFGPPRADDLDTGELHGVFGSRLGAGWSTLAPAAGEVRLDVSGGTIMGAAVTRRRVRQYEVRFASGGALLSGTFTVPPGPGRHPAVAFVSGSGPTQRAYLPDLQALLVDSGVAVLAYDKRGVAMSGGIYPGESSSDEAIDRLARDAQAAVRWLAQQPDVDPARVGLAGHSQAGWIMPLAASRETAVHYIVAFSSPAVTVDETDMWQNLTGQGEQPAMLSDAEIEAEVERRGPGGFDPLPSIRALRIPVLWVYGGLDRHIPSRLSERRLAPLAAGHEFTVLDFPHANHALVETQTGLTAEMLRSNTFAPGLFAAVRAWLSGASSASASAAAWRDSSPPASRPAPAPRPCTHAAPRR